MSRMSRDEHPSSEDLERFGGDTALCPECGAEVWDEADVCPKCFAYLGGDTFRRSRIPPAVRMWIIIALVAAMAVGALVLAPW